MRQYPRDGEYVIVEDFNDLVKAFDALIAATEKTKDMLVDTPECTITGYDQTLAVELDTVIDNAIGMLEAGINRAKEFE